MDDGGNKGDKIMRHFIDKATSKFISRKFLVFITATAGLLHGDITSPDWVVIATAYVGLQGFVDIAERLKK